MTADRETRPDLDRLDLPASSIHLDGDYAAAWCVGSDGEARAWLVATDPDADEHPCGGTPAHELLGKLPGSVLIAIHGDLPRCGHETRQSGTYCRIPVHVPGARCRWHHPDQIGGEPS
jgi:hypothetical protein